MSVLFFTPDLPTAPSEASLAPAICTLIKMSASGFYWARINYIFVGGQRPQLHTGAHFQIKACYSKVMNRVPRGVVGA